MPIEPEIYFSFDIEADGGYPSRYSMLSIGMVACGSFDGVEFKPFDLDYTFYSTIKPITDEWVPEAVEVAKEGGADREELLVSGLSPYTVMDKLVQYVRKLAPYGGPRPIAICYPSWDWQWLYDYMERFAVENPFGFSGMIDIKSWYAGRRKALVVNSTKRNMPKTVKSSRPHTHNALDDALEQAEMFCNMWEKL